MISRELKIGIIGGLASSVLVIIFIQPALSLLWSTALAFGESIQAGYVDRIYRNAAAGENATTANLALLGVIFLLIITSTQLLTSEAEKGGTVYYRHLRILKITNIAGAVFITPIFLVAASLFIGVSEINASFSQRLAVLSPAISDQEQKEWQARWAKMQGQNDYRELVAAMEARALALKIELPTLRKP